MRLNPGAFDQWLGQNIGQAMDWSSAFRCSCQSPNNPNSGAADPKCPTCSGKGYLWVDPVPTVCGVSGQRAQLAWANSGEWQSGDVVITIPGSSPMWDMGEFDRVVLRNATDKFSLPLTRGAAQERFLFQVQRVDRVFWLHPTTKEIVEGGIPEVGADGRLIWGAGAPLAGTRYSITGHKFAEYYCFKELVSNRSEHQGARLPKKAVLRRFDLFGR